MRRRSDPGQRTLAWCLFIIVFAYSGLQFFSDNAGPDAVAITTITSTETATKTETVSVASNLTGETVVVHDSGRRPLYKHVNIAYGMSTAFPLSEITTYDDGESY